MGRPSLPSIYILDDDPAVVRALVRQLNGFGYSVAGTAHDPEQAVREISELRPGLVLADLNLRARLDGVAVALLMRAAGIGTPVVFLTGEPEPDLSALRGTDGIFAYLRKHELGDNLRTTLTLVADQAETQARLRAVDQRHRLLFEQAAVGVVEFDFTTGRILEVNRRCAEILRRSEAELRACLPESLFVPGTLQRARTELGRARHHEVTFDAECITGDGAIVHLRLDVTPLRLPDARAVRAVVIVQDQTARAQAERASRRSQELLDQSQRIARVGSYALDPRTGGVIWSAEMYRLFEVDPATFTPSWAAVLAMFHPDDRARVADSTVTTFAAADQPVPPHVLPRYRIVTGAGNLRLFEGRGDVVIDEAGLPVMVGTVRDVTHEEAAAAALRDGEARYRSVFASAVGGIVRASVDGVVVEANPAFVAIVGCTSAEQVIGTDLRTWFRDPAAAGRLAFEQWEAGHLVETTWRRLDGGIASVVLEGVTLGRSDDRYFLGFVRDLTAERARSAREREAIEAIEASRAKTAFLAGMSHELRTPLNAVLGLSEALLEGTFGSLVEPQVRALETVHASGQHLLALINDVLDIARVEAGQLPIEPEHISLRAPIEESLALVFSQAARRGQRLVTELPPELPALELDKRRIKQVLINLLGNAVKFSPPDATITLRVRLRPDDVVELAVIDHGPGIPIADRERVFEPFVTLDRSVSREFGGAGLGLTMVKRIVELHGGRVRVEATPGGGSTFVVELQAPPRARPQTLPQVGRVPAPPRPDRPVVLLAEDDPANVLTVQAFLERRGFVVRVVHDGASAVLAAAAPDVAAILMDVRLPVLDGLDAIRRIRAAEAGVHKPIIALTAFAMPADEARCLEAGATSYRSKPVRLAQLADQLTALLAGGAP